MTVSPRVALFADTFHEVNGAARTCREWDAVQERVRQFARDFIHLTSPGDLGILGAVVAARLCVPLAASWHTNLHEFASRRVARMIRWWPAGLQQRTLRRVEQFVLDRVCWFFGRAQLVFAPNPDLAAMLSEKTGRPVFPMGRGIDTQLFHPSRRARTDPDVVLAFVGRLMPEKNLRILPAVARALREYGIERFRFQISGSGSERACWNSLATPRRSAPRDCAAWLHARDGSGGRVHLLRHHDLVAGRERRRSAQGPAFEPKGTDLLGHRRLDRRGGRGDRERALHSAGGDSWRPHQRTGGDGAQSPGGVAEDRHDGNRRRLAVLFANAGRHASANPTPTRAAIFTRGGHTACDSRGRRTSALRRSSGAAACWAPMPRPFV